MGKHVERYNAAGERYCDGCQAYLPPPAEDSFSRDARRPDGLRSYCRLCSRRMNKANYQRTGARQRERSRQWTAAHPFETLTPAQVRVRRTAKRRWALTKRIEQQTRQKTRQRTGQKERQAS